MSSINELQENRAKLLSDARSILTADKTLTTEDRAKAEAMINDAEAIKTQIRNLENIEKEFAAEPIKRGAVGENRSKDEVRENANRELRNYIKSRGQASETRDITIAADGGIFLPTDVSQPVTVKKGYGYLYDQVNHLDTISGAPVRVPVLDDRTNGFVLQSTTSNTADPAISSVTISVDQYKIQPILLDKELVNDVNFDLVAWTQDAVDQRYMRSTNKVIAQGNGSAVSAITASVGNSVTSTSNASVSYKDLVNLKANLDPAYMLNASYMFNQSTFAAVESLVDSNGRPLFIPFMGGLQTGTYDAAVVGIILGFPVRLAYDYSSQATGTTFATFGDHNAAYTFRRVLNTAGQPYALTILQERYADQNAYGVVAFGRIGGATVNPSAIVGLVGK
jgi:HK97 family phage major capsid protein